MVFADRVSDCFDGKVRRAEEAKGSNPWQVLGFNGSSQLRV